MDEIRNRAGDGLSLHAGKMCLSRAQDGDVTLYNAARKLFGSWSDALLAAGVKIDQNH